MCLRWHFLCIWLPIAGASPSFLQVSEGRLRGECNEETKVCFYGGIPFAAPPVGGLRFKAPQLSAPWNGTRDATKFGDACLQIIPESGNMVMGKESCLFLNVWAPAGIACTGSCTVMFFIHGGAFMSDSGMFYDGSKIVALVQDVIVVTINYRLGLFGFLGSKMLASKDASGSTGNYGLQDQRAAMHWVKNNIHSFGGESNRIAIFGESAGAASISAHLVMPKSWPLYSNAIMMSGAFAYWGARSMADASKQYESLCKAANCHDPECLLAYDAEKLLVLAMTSLPGGSEFAVIFAPTVDGVELLEFPWNLLRDGAFNQVPVLLGTNRDEGTQLAANLPYLKKGFGMTMDDLHSYLESWLGSNPSLLHQAMLHYPVGGADFPNPYWAATRFLGDLTIMCPSYRTALALAKFNGDSYAPFLYEFNHVPLNPPFPEGVPSSNGSAGASHFCDMQFLFQGLNQTGWPLGSLIGPGEVELAKTMGYLWSNFAKRGDPNIGLHTPLEITWPRFTALSSINLQIGLPRFSTDAKQIASRCSFIDPLGPLVQRFEKAPGYDVLVL